MRRLSALLLLLAAAPPSAFSCLEEGAALYRSGGLTAAAELFSSAACVKAAGAQAHLNAGVVYRDLGLDAEAYAAFKKALRQAGHDPEARLAFGWAALRSGRVKEAEKTFRDVLETDAGSSLGLLGLGRALFKQGEPEKAAGVLEDLTGKTPAFSLGWVNLARVYEALGKREQAASAYERTFANDWTYFEARLPLARIYRSLEDLARSWMQYARILQTAPRHAESARSERELGELLGRSREDALPRLTLAEPLPVHPARRTASMPLIAVGIGTDAAGRPGLRDALVLSGTGPLWLLDPDTGRRIKQLNGGQDLLISRHGKGSFQITDPLGKTVGRFGSAIALEPVNWALHSIILRDVRVEKGYSWSSVRDRQFKGRLEVRARGGRLYAVNRLPVEDYLYGVVTREMPAAFPEEALKAQAVIARGSGLFWHRYPRHKEAGYHVCDGQHCQVYAGMPGECPESRRAADGTRGLTLHYRGRPAHTLFSANCGGHTQDSSELSGWSDLPYLKGSPDAPPQTAPPSTPWEFHRWLTGVPAVYCNVPEKAGIVHFRWTRAVPAEELAERVNRIKRVGELKRVLALKRSRSGNVNALLFEGTEGSVTVDREQRIRSVLGLASLKSTLFIVETERDERGVPVEFVFYGGGWGHGVGLCQHGAAGRALAGQEFRQILEHYYPGTELKPAGY